MGCGDGDGIEANRKDRLRREACILEGFVLIFSS